MDELQQRWTALVEPSPQALDVGADLLRRWNEAHRHYHAATHLLAVLDAVDALAPDAHSPDTVRLAAWFHDAVYDGRPGADECASADLARTALTRLGLPRDRIDEVARLVLLTASHDPAPDDPDGAVLCDADLAVLGGSPGEYAAYAAAVRQDYAQVPDDVFNAGRAAVLKNLLDHQPLFHTEIGWDRWESAARRNLETELILLRAAR